MVAAAKATAWGTGGDKRAAPAASAEAPVAVAEQRAAASKKLKMTLAPREPEPIASVVGALERASHVSATGRGMLARMASSCLSTPAEGRHEFQSEVAAMLQDILSEAASGMQQALRRAIEAEEEARSTRAACERDLDGWQQKVNESNDDLEAAQDGFSEINTALEEERKKLHRFQTERVALEAKGAEAQELKAKLETVLQEHYMPLLQGTDEKAERHAAAIHPLLSRIELEESLRRAFAGAARVKLEKRGVFDRAVLTQLELEIGKQVLHLGTVVEGQAQKIGSSDEQLASAGACLQEARKRQAASAAGLRSADVEVWEAEGAYAVAEEKLREADAALVAAQTARLALERQSNAFRAGPLAVVDRLCPQEAPSTRAAESAV